MSQREITIYDIAARLNISAATVSRALNNHPSISEKTKKRIREVALEVNYRSNTFASNLRRSRTNTIGVLVPRLDSYFMSSVLAGMESIANDAGYNLIICQSLEKSAREISNAHTMFNKRVDALVVSLSSETADFSHFKPFINKKIPILFFDRIAEQLNATKIIIDNFSAGYDATKHLIDQGCKRIAHITSNTVCFVYKERLKGYHQALIDHNLPFSNDYVIYNNLNELSAKSAGEQILSLKRKPDGIFAANDTCAVHFMRYVQNCGLLIPKNMAIVGFNNDPTTTIVEPQLSTINYPGYEMGQLAIKKIIEQLNDKNHSILSETLVLKSELLIRKSSSKFELK